MKVTVTRYRENTAGNGGTKAFADVVINGTFALNGMTINEAKDKETGEPYQFVGSPSYKDKSGEYHNYVTGMSHEFTQAVLGAYTAAQADPEGKGSVGEGGKDNQLWMEPRVTPYTNEAMPQVCGLASIKVSADKEAEKSDFTLTGLRVENGRGKGEGRVFVAYPERAYEDKTTGDKKYAPTISALGKSKGFVDNLVIHAAKEAGIITPKQAKESEAPTETSIADMSHGADAAIKDTHTDPGDGAPQQEMSL